MNRNKKPFPSGMRVAALYLLMGVLLLLAVTLFSGRESMRATEEYFDRTISFVKVQSTSYEKYNDTITAKSLRRMAVSVRQLAENDALDLYDPEALREETESLWLTGIAVLDENGESLCEYTDSNISYAQFAESLREQAALNVLQNPQKTYLKRILLQDGTAVDVATRRAAAGDAVLLAYRVTPPEFVEGAALSIQSVLDGYPKNISGTIFIVQDNKVIAANDPSLIGLYTTNSPLVQGIRKAGAPDTLTHTRDWANSGCYFGMYSNGRNFDLYLYISEKSVFRNASSALLTALIFYLICVAVLQTLRRRSAAAAEQQRKEQEQKYHAQLEEQNRKLELAVRHEAAANRAKREFLFNMSHDIRTPMNAIIGFANLAQNAKCSTEQMHSYLSKILVASQHLLSLINDILEMSRIESGKITLEPAPTSWNEMLQELQTIMQEQIESKKQSFTISIAPLTHDYVMIDKLRMEQVLVNLVSNASKYTPERGSIRVELAQYPADKPNHALYKISVIDNGMGMSEDFVKKIFSPFERANNSTVSKIQGTGLGMSITKSIVDLANGTIDVKSKLGEGTEIIVAVTLCLCTDAETAARNAKQLDKQQAQAEQPDFKGKRLLVVEDNKLNREITVTILEQTGIITEQAEDGSVAVKMVQEAAPGYYDLILMDIQMPIMDGYEATKQIRVLPDKRLAQLPIIAVSANAFEEDKKTSLAAGMDGHIAKPINVPDLFALMQKLIK